MKITLTSILLSALALCSSSAALLSIDFGPSTVEAGFTGQAIASDTYTTAAGDITVTSDGSFFNRGSGGTNPDLFRDFTFKNANEALTLTLSGVGIEANTMYIFKFWSYDANAGSKTHSQSFAGVSGTTGAAGPIVYPAGSPTSLDSFSAIGNFTSDGSGIITIELTDTITAGANNPEPRLNGFEITAVPEPSTTALLGLGGLALILSRRK